jgi:hypothetical protein
VLPLNRTEQIGEDELNNHELTQFQLECERLLIERLAQAGSSISNRTLGFLSWPLPAPFSRWSGPGKRRTYITGTIEGTDITFWIYEDWAMFDSSYGSPEFLDQAAEEFVAAVLKTIQKEKAKINPRHP